MTTTELVLMVAEAAGRVIGVVLALGFFVGCKMWFGRY